MSDTLVAWDNDTGFSDLAKMKLFYDYTAESGDDSIVVAENGLFNVNSSTVPVHLLSVYVYANYCYQHLCIRICGLVGVRYCGVQYCTHAPPFKPSNVVSQVRPSPRQRGGAEPARLSIQTQ